LTNRKKKLQKNKNMRKINLRTKFLFCLCFAGLFSSGQTLRTAENSLLLTDFTTKIDNYFIEHPSVKFHSSFRPYLYLTLKEYKDSATTFKSFPVDHHYAFEKSLFQKPNYRNTVDLQVIPLVDLQGGYDMLRSKFVNETSGGVYLRKDINDDFSAAISVSGGTATYPVFTDTVVKSWGILPGMGMAYGNSNKYKWSNWSGYISYTPKSLFNFQLGKDKQFIGDGYRSLLLSDVANNYPYFRSSINVWHLQYSCWYSWFRDIYNSDGLTKNFRNKFGTFHYLSWNISKNVNFSLFESIIWQGTDTNRVRTFDANYLNPVIFFRPVEYSLGSSDNAFVGINFSWKLAKTLKFYLQAVADEFYLKEIRAKRGWWANKQGVQVGMKYVNAFTIKNLMLQGEFNTVRPYTYSHGSPQQSYSHFNQQLAHPFGANFYEALGILSYKYKRWALDFKGVYAVIGKDTLNSNVSMGQNIFISYINRPKLANGNPQEYGHELTQGVKTTYLQTDIKLTYYLVPDMNLRMELGYIQTNLSNEKGFDRQAPFIYLGIRSSLHNFYRDF
jgi:hypothetical protein